MLLKDTVILRVLITMITMLLVTVGSWKCEEFYLSHNYLFTFLSNSFLFAMLWRVNLIQFRVTVWSLYQLSLGECWGKPWTGRQSITRLHEDKQLYTLTLTSRVNLDSLINLMCAFGQWEKIRAPRGYPCIHRERT